MVHATGGSMSFGTTGLNKDHATKMANLISLAKGVSVK
jgi:hypothetical protein